MTERALSTKPVWLRALIRIGVVAVVAVLLLIAAASYTAMQPRTELHGCEVSDVTVNPGGRRSVSSLTVHGSCGDLQAPRHWQALIDVGQTYDFTVRGWSWESPTIINVEGWR